MIFRVNMEVYVRKEIKLGLGVFYLRFSIWVMEGYLGSFKFFVVVEYEFFLFKILFFKILVLEKIRKSLGS